MTAERLSEEWIDHIQEMALCNYVELSAKTNFPLELVYNWKDQAIPQSLTGDIVIDKIDSKDKKFLSDSLDEKFGILTMSSFINITDNLTNKKANGTDKYKLYLFGFFNLDEKDQKKYIQVKYLFENIAK